jgi:hypothetical protein
MRHKRTGWTRQMLVIVSATGDSGRRAVSVFFPQAKLEALVLGVAGSFAHGWAAIAVVAIMRV